MRTGARVGAGVGSFGTYNADAQASAQDRLYVAVHGLQSTGNFPYLSDGGTVLNANNASMQTRSNNALIQGSGALRLQEGPWRLGAWALARDQGLAGYGTRQTHTAEQRTQRYVAYVAHADDAQLSTSIETLSFSDPNGELNGLPMVSEDFAARVDLHLHDERTFTWATWSNTADVRLDQIILRDARNDITAPPVDALLCRLGLGVGYLVVERACARGARLAFGAESRRTIRSQSVSTNLPRRQRAAHSFCRWPAWACVSVGRTISR